MFRKSKSTNITPNAEDGALQRQSDVRSPFAWFEEMDRWFDDFRREFESRFRGPRISLSPWRDESGLQFRAPLVDLVDTGREFLVKAELPGVVKEDLDISVTADGLEVRAETKRKREEKGRDYDYRERVYNGYHRAVSLPEEVLPDQAEARLKDGVLEVRIPKREPTPKSEPVKVPVSRSPGHPLFLHPRIPPRDGPMDR